MKISLVSNRNNSSSEKNSSSSSSTSDYYLDMMKSALLEAEDECNDLKKHLDKMNLLRRSRISIHQHMLLSPEDIARDAAREAEYSIALSDAVEAQRRLISRLSYCVNKSISCLSVIVDNIIEYTSNEIITALRLEISRLEKILRFMHNKNIIADTHLLIPLLAKMQNTHFDLRYNYLYISLRELI